MEPAAPVEAAAEINPEAMMEPAAPVEAAVEVNPQDMMEPAAQIEAAAESVAPASVETAPAPVAAQPEPVSEPIDDPQAEIVTERIPEPSVIEPVEAEIVTPAAPIPAESLPEPAAASAELSSAEIPGAETPSGKAPGGEGSLSAAMGAVAAAVHAAGADDGDQSGVVHALETEAAPSAPSEASAFDELAQGGVAENVGAPVDEHLEDGDEPVVARMEPGTIPHSPVPSFLRGVETEASVEDADGSGGIFGSGTADLRLEAIVRDALKPRLKEWLDEHLSELVDQMIREEVQSMVGKRRSTG